MSHELEQFDNGQTAFFTARIDAWHRLGTVTPDCLTAEQVMDTAMLGGWNVRKEPLHTTILSGDGVTTLPVADKYASVRTNPATGKPDILGVVGTDYTPVQNEETCELLNTLVDESGAHFETAGSLKGGRHVFVTMKLPQQMRIAGVDTIDLYLAATTSHDGTSALRVDATPVRIVCANTQRAALRASQSHYSFRHTRNAKNRIAQAREALGLMWTYHDEFQKAAERMINDTLTTTEFDHIIKKLWPLDEPNPSPRTRNNHLRRNTTLRQLFTDADTQKNIRG